MEIVATSFIYNKSWSPWRDTLCACTRTCTYMRDADLYEQTVRSEDCECRSDCGSM